MSDDPGRSEHLALGLSIALPCRLRSTQQGSYSDFSIAYRTSPVVIACLVIYDIRIICGGYFIYHELLYKNITYLFIRQ